MASADAGQASRLDHAAAARRVVEALDDDALRALLVDAEHGWGRVRRIEVGGHRLFVKAVPVTGTEVRSGLTTANVYGIPTYLNYPFGSPGLGVGRELAFARRTRGWVESGACVSFPILVHDRLISRPARDQSGSTTGYSAYRAGEPAMDRYLHDRARASADIYLVFEDLGTNAVDWLIEHPSDAGWILDEVRSTIDFLQINDVVHFDTDLFNVVTDGVHAFVVDHGLVLDAAFELAGDERTFLAANRHFDAGNLVMSFGHQLYWMYKALPAEQRQRIDDRLDLHDASFDVAVQQLLVSVDELEDDGLLDVALELRMILNRYRPAIAYMHDFFSRARASWSDGTRLDDRRLAQLLDVC